MSSVPVTPARRPLGPAWHHSSFSTGADATCVDVAARGASICVRDSKDPDGPRLTFSPREWHVFLLGIRAGEFELPGALAVHAVDHRVTGPGRAVDPTRQPVSSPGGTVSTWFITIVSRSAPGDGRAKPRRIGGNTITIDPADGPVDEFPCAALDVTRLGKPS